MSRLHYCLKKVHRISGKAIWLMIPFIFVGAVDFFLFLTDRFEENPLTEAAYFAIITGAFFTSAYVSKVINDWRYSLLVVLVFGIVVPWTFMISTLIAYPNGYQVNSSLDGVISVSMLIGYMEIMLYFISLHVSAVLAMIRLVKSIIRKIK